MSLLIIGVVVWAVAVVFLCSLGRAAKVGDRVASVEARSFRPGRTAGIEANGSSRPGLTATPVAGAHAGSALRGRLTSGREDRSRRELLDAYRALSHAEARIAQLEDRPRAGAL